MAGRLLYVLKRLPPGVLASVAFHGLLLLALFTVTGVLAPGSGVRRTALIRSDAPPPPDEVEILPEPDRLEPLDPFPVPAPVPFEQPPEEPPLFESEPTAPLPPDAMTPPDSTPAIRLKPPVTARRPAPSPEPAPAPPRGLSPPPPPPPAPTRAVPERQPHPYYPTRAVDRRLEGRVILVAEVLPDGTVGTIEVKVSSGHAILDRAAIRAVRKWHFRPARVQGQPVRSLVECPFRFTLP